MWFWIWFSLIVNGRGVIAEDCQSLVAGKKNSQKNSQNFPLATPEDLDFILRTKKWTDLTDFEKQQVARAINTWMIPEIEKYLTLQKIKFRRSIGSVQGDGWTESNVLLTISLPDQSSQLFSHFKGLPLIEITIAPLKVYISEIRGSYHKTTKQILLRSLDLQVIRHEIRHAMTRAQQNKGHLSARTGFEVSPDRISDDPLFSAHFLKFANSLGSDSQYLFGLQSDMKKTYGTYCASDELFTYAKDVQSVSRNFSSHLNEDLMDQIVSKVVRLDFIALYFLAAHDLYVPLFSGKVPLKRNLSSAYTDRIAFPVQDKKPVLFRVVTLEQKNLFKKLGINTLVNDDFNSLFKSYGATWDQLGDYAKKTLELNAKVFDELLSLRASQVKNFDQGAPVRLKQLLHDYGSLY